MQLRRSFALAAAAALTVGLSSCGFDYATDRYYTPAAGTNAREGVVDVLAAVVVSTEPGSGTFVASLSNNSPEDTHSLTGLGGELTADGFEPIEVPAGSLVNLADPAADVKVTGEFEAGDFVSVDLGFDNGETISMDVVVVPNSGDYADLDGPAPAEETTETDSSESEDH